MKVSLGMGLPWVRIQVTYVDLSARGGSGRSSQTAPQNRQLIVLISNTKQCDLVGDRTKLGRPSLVDHGLGEGIGCPVRCWSIKLISHNVVIQWL